MTINSGIIEAPIAFSFLFVWRSPGDALEDHVASCLCVCGVWEQVIPGNASVRHMGDGHRPFPSSC